MSPKSDLSTKKIMLTGGAGFLGTFVAQKLKAMPVPHKRYAHQAAKARGCKDIFIPAEQHYDLTKAPAIEAAFKASKPEIVIHLAAKVGGIGAWLGGGGNSPALLLTLSPESG